MDKFPEAFERFEKVVQVRRIESFRQLELSFVSWAGENWGGTRKQEKALAVQAEKHGIPAPIMLPFERRGKPASACYRPLLYRFVTKEGTFKKREYKVIYTSEKIKGEYVGMNYQAFKEKWPRERYGHRRTTILIYRGLNKKEKEETIRHELVEVERMKAGESYRKAHREAKKAEKS